MMYVRGQELKQGDYNEEPEIKLTPIQTIKKEIKSFNADNRKIKKYLVEQLNENHNKKTNDFILKELEKKGVKIHLPK